MVVIFLFICFSKCKNNSFYRNGNLNMHTTVKLCNYQY